VLAKTLHPVEGVVPPGRRHVQDGHPQALEEEAHALAQKPARQQEAALAEHGRGGTEGTAAQPLEVTRRARAEIVLVVDETNDDVGVDEDQADLRSLLRMIRPA
jgi:hypothetical protein